MYCGNGLYFLPFAKFYPYYFISIDGSGDESDDESEDNVLEKGNRFDIS